MKLRDLAGAAVALGLALEPTDARADDGVDGATISAARPPTTARLRSIMSLVQAPAGHILPPPQAPLETEVAPPPVSKQIAREAVAGERAALPPEPPTGRGMMIAGGSMVGGGILLSLLVILIAENAGGWCWAEDAETQMLCVERAKNRYGRYLGLVPAGVIFAGGIALVAVGGHRQSRWYRWKQNQTVAPNTSRTVFGTWTAGMTLRF